MKSRKPLRGALTALVVILLYFILAPHPLGREPVLRGAWSIDLTARRPQPPARAVELAPFQLGDRFGFVSSDGALAFLGSTGFRVTLSRRGFVTYPRVGTTWLLQDGIGQVELPFSGNGYPMLSPDGTRLFLVRTDLTGLTELSSRGETVWTRDFASLMTTASVVGDWIAVGLLDGTVSLVDRAGALAFERTVGGSRIPVALGCAVSADGSRVAAVTGIDPQLLTVFEHRRSGWTVAAQAALGTDYRREVRIGFAPDGRWLVSEGRDGAAVLEAVTGRLATLAMRGALAGLVFQGPDNRSFGALASRSGSSMDLAIVQAGAVFHRETIALDDATQPGPYLAAAGDRLIMAAGNRVSGLAFEER